MERHLFTVGYEGQSVESFVETLHANAVKHLIDVREIPLSRKKGFSKTALKEHLNRNNIQYIHFKELGSPRQARKRLKETGNYTVFFKVMEKHLSHVNDSVIAAYQYVAGSTCCLMCFEKEAQNCHRSMVARKIKEVDGNGLLIKNL